MSEWTPEHSYVPEELQDEQQALEAEIHEAFRGVMLEGGTSWMQAEWNDARDHSTNTLAAAAISGDEESWEGLVKNEYWREDIGVGGFVFLDGLGFRYYIAPALIRCLRRGEGALVGVLISHGDHFPGLFTERQLAAMARFVRFMIAVEDARQLEGEPWRDAYRRIWKAWDQFPEADVSGRRPL